MTVELEPMPGEGLLVRRGGLTALTVCDASGTADEIAALVTEVADSGGDGHELLRRLTDILLTRTEELTVCAAGETAAGGVAVLAAGAAVATVTAEGRDVVVGDAGISGLATRVVPTGRVSVRAVLTTSAPANTAGAGVRLDTGTLRASGFLMRPKTVSLTTTVPAPAGTVAAAERPAAEGVTAAGLACGRGHLNDPRTPYCAVCGLAAGAAPRPRRRAARPPLGVLLLDDGRQIQLDCDVVLGADPIPDVPGVTAVVLQGGGIGAEHVRITLHDWQVTATDLGASATHLCIPSRTGWSALVAGTPTAMPPGTVLAIGERQVRFDSHWPLTGREMA